MTSAAATGRRFAVAFSFAGEDRLRVAPLAEALAERLGQGRVLYDRFHEAELARPGLDVYLPRLYLDQSELIVVVLSPDYPRKAWCGLELRWIRQLLPGPGNERIMLLSLGDPGDLSDLGLLPGDGYLEVSHRPAAEVVARILERLALQGLAPGAGKAPGAGDRARALPLWMVWRRRWPGPRRAALLAAGVFAAAAVAGPLAWRLASERLARAQLAAGDAAFSRFDKAYAGGEQDLHLRQAESAWRQSALLDPSLAEPRARLAFLHDLRGELPEAEAAWNLARTLEPSHTDAARSYRIGRAGVLAQLPGREHEALSAYEADPDHPRAAVELAMLRWGEPAALPRALDAVTRPELAASLSGGSGPSPGWSFPLPGQNVLLVFNRRNQQRCILQSVRATTAHLLGAQPLPASPLAAADCQGSQVDVRGLLCRRLPRPAAHTRAAVTARWLGCPEGGIGTGSGNSQAVRRSAQAGQALIGALAHFDADWVAALEQRQAEKPPVREWESLDRPARYQSLHFPDQDVRRGGPSESMPVVPLRSACHCVSGDAAGGAGQDRGQQGGSSQRGGMG